MKTMIKVKLKVNARILFLSILIGLIPALGILFWSKDKTSLKISSQVQAQTNSNDWSMVGANPQRTSWVSTQVSGNLNLEWYKPIEAFIPQNSQLIATNNMIYVSSARGLYALAYDTGNIIWHFDTELPLGNSPTVVGGVAYVGGMDKKLYALDANTGLLLWSFDGATAGYSANPLVLNDVIYAANRDESLYAIGAQGSTRQGQQIWKFSAGGPIIQSPAYKDGVIYFAANDNYGYAVNTANGSLKWKSANQLPGDAWQSYWPVIYTDPISAKDYVIFSAASSYRHSGLNPGTGSVAHPVYQQDSPFAWDCNPSLNATCTLKNYPYSNYETMQKDGVFPWQSSPTNYTPPGGALPTVNLPDAWAQGKIIYDGTNITNYLENMSWRRTFIVLDTGTGQEFTQDANNNGKPDYAPITLWQTKTGNMYPPVVGADGTLYVENIYSAASGSYSIAQGRVWGWRMGTPYFMESPGRAGQGAMDEPQSISMGGNILYRSICCDRVGDFFDVRPSTTPNLIPSGSLWNYSKTLLSQAGDYNEMWWGEDPTQGYPGLEGNYGGNTALGAPHDGRNGIYNNNGQESPMIPYNGKIYAFHSNTIFAYGTGTQQGNKGLLRVTPANENLTVPTTDDLKAKLEAEINKMDTNGDGALDNLRPAYYGVGQVAPTILNDYFDNPGETVYTLTQAYPYLSATTQQKVKTFLQTEFANYFNPTMYSHIGWSEGQSREAMPIPSDVLPSMAASVKSTLAGNSWSWQYPQENFYALWKYTQIVPTDASTAYNLAKSKLEIHSNLDATYFNQNTWELNGYIAGYIGFLNLQKMVSMDKADATLRNNVQTELTRLEGIWVNSISKDTPWIDPNNSNLPAHSGPYHYRNHNIDRIFINLVPELGDYLNQNALSKIQSAWEDYNYVAPYWFVSRYDAINDEGVNGPLDIYHALFQAKVYALKQPYSELVKYLDVPAFARGDLFYIQNLTAALSTVLNIFSPDINQDGHVDRMDLSILFDNWNTARDKRADINGDGIVNGVDFALLMKDWGKTIS
ncbi:MAG: PQQ-binding-like beta-propeller repeat protein [Patescibacteria group bacterium]|nr:PQQ-binding-like beta-propeller repeat protein [Patescibacteria group bacterium]